MGIAVEFDRVTKRFPKSSRDAVSELSIQIREGEIVALLGTSGCGKTTLLKMVNRLVEPDGGTIRFFGEDTQKMNPVDLRRKIGYVIQQSGLFPHFTVAENIATVPAILKWDRQRIDARVKQLMELVGLPHAEYGGRYPGKLSGGQQQRVGLARALAADPLLMLLDEPFGAIDAITRRNLQDELLKIHRAIGGTFLFVTHDIHEAFRLADRILVMDGGRVQQFGTASEIRNLPANGFVAQLVESARQQQLDWDLGGGI